MSAIYAPPYESEIEDSFAYNVVRYLADDVELAPQVSVQTICGRFILDFILQSPSRGRIAVECDGREFHDESRDEWRDAMILGGEFVDAIYRLRGSDIHYHIEDLLYLLSRLDPWVMSKRGATNLELLATPEAKSALLEANDNDIHSFRYHADEQGSLRMEVRRTSIASGQRRFWQAAYAYAKSIGGGDLDDVIAKYRRGA